MNIELWIVLLLPLLIGSVVGGVVIHRVKNVKRFLLIYSLSGVLYIMLYVAYLSFLKPHLF
ncbi:hypothetical protein [Halalkalibacter krulwichiae]|uniref:Uncharacterized protein n=1 Tax=Halalkalibacter krulwichiae TaxID=199441 RepID=A0A1X9MGD1_9BACI|nr:hypothetical protein [Halalkalibacter krulwichiae]ARK32507.1 hypothetical protein BkAM31D_23030 [Halalkalibacter krulwichiae]